MGNGPLIPGMREFDVPRRRVPRWLPWLLATVGVVLALVLAAGFVAGAGPLKFLGMTTQALTPTAYRPTATESVIQVAVALPASGLCREDVVSAVAFERGSRIEVEASLTRPSRQDCPVATIGGNVAWVDVALQAPLGDRTVIRLPGREPIQRDQTTQDGG